jgi:hypothetical protein
MKHKAKTNALPLSMWVPVFAIVTTLLAYSASIAHWVEAREFADSGNFNAARLFEHGHPKLVTMLGSSLTHHALNNDQNMQRVLATSGIDTSFVRFTANGAFPESYESVLPLIIQARPQLVIIELEMMLIEIPVASPLFNLRRMFASLRNTLVRGSNGMPARFKGNFGQKRECERLMTEERAAQIDVSGLIQSKFSLLSSELTPTWREFIKQIQANGGRVVFSEIGRSGFAAQAITPTFKKAYEQTIVTLQDLYSVDIWRYPGPFDLEKYCDLAHLNDIGRENFVRWLVPELRKALYD